ncbi:MAG: class I SAM-dependent DNA methyltransferase [Candidatus Caldatribacteriaceae bacterium]
MPWYFNEQHFENLYRRQEDPWQYKSSLFEREKYQKTLQTIPQEVQFILEIGCSEGVFTELLLQKGKRVLGIDISETALQRAQERLKKYSGQFELKKVNIVADNKLVGPFDLVLASEVLYYLGNHSVLLSLEEKFFHLLREEGYLLLVHFYPSGKIIHDIFSRKGHFERVWEEVTYHPERDYIITLFQKIRISSKTHVSMGNND